MAISTVATIQTSVAAIFNSLVARKNFVNAQAAVAALSEVAVHLRKAYTYDVAVTLVDGTDATALAAYAATGQIGIAYAAAGLAVNGLAPVGSVFKVLSGTPDFTDDALGTAKGSGVAAGDLFLIATASTVTYLGTAVPALTAYQTEDL